MRSTKNVKNKFFIRDGNASRELTKVTRSIIVHLPFHDDSGSKSARSGGNYLCPSDVGEPINARIPMACPLNRYNIKISDRLDREIRDT